MAIFRTLSKQSYHQNMYVTVFSLCELSSMCVAHGVFIVIVKMKML